MADSQRTCRIKGCNTQARTSGMCRKHWIEHRNDPASGAVRCSVEGCEKAALSKGMCSAHYQRLRAYGDPLAGRRPHGSGLTFLRMAATTKTDECLFWDGPVSGGGYGVVVCEGKQKGAHVVSCELAHGPAPEGMEVAHACGNGLCVNPRHLRWATRSQNHYDKHLHGTMMQGESHVCAKLNADQVRWLRKNHGQISIAEMARECGVSFMAAKNAIARKTWKHVQ